MADPPAGWPVSAGRPARILLAIITLDVDAFESLLDYTDIIHMTHISTLAHCALCYTLLIK